MIYIISGVINSGKSTCLVSLYNSLNIGDGFYNSKIYKESEYIGQEIVCLSNELHRPFSFLLGYIPPKWDEIYRFKDYSFSASGVHFAESIINREIKNAHPFFIDELGPLELQGKGLYNGFYELLKTDKDIYAVIRKQCINDIIEEFNVKEYKILYPIL